VRAHYKKLEEVCDVIDPHPSHRAPKVVADGIPFVGIGDFNQSGKVITDKARRVSSKIYDEHKERYSLDDNLLAIGRVASIGKVVHLEKLEEIYTISPTLAVLRPYDIDEHYLFYALQSPEYKKQLDQLSTGSTRRSVGMKNLRISKVPIVSNKEQKRIVAILDEAFAGIDQAIANTERNLASARELFESYLNTIFTQKGEEWEENTLAKIAIDFGRGKSKHRPRNDPKLYGGKYPFIQTGDVRNSGHFINEYSQTYNENGLAQSKLWPKSTLCITIAANIAETGVLTFDACFPDSIIGLVVDEEKYSISFIEYYLQFTKVQLQAAGKGSAQDNINLATFENWMFSFPSYDEQIRIVEVLNKIDEQSRELRRISIQKLAVLNELKQSLLQKAFSGELTATNVVTFPVSVEKDTGIETTSSEFSANVLAFAHYWHASQKRDKTFGRVKAQKTLHLIESVCAIDLGRTPKKDAAGPNDFPHMLKAEDWAKANHFFEFTPRRVGNGYDFKKLGDYNKLIGGALAAVQPYRDKLEKILALMLPMDTRQAEVLATVHAAWNNLLLDNANITDEAIIYEARENWTESKRSIPEEEFRKSIVTIRTNGIIPDGTAKRVTGQENLL